MWNISKKDSLISWSENRGHSHDCNDTSLPHNLENILTLKQKEAFVAHYIRQNRQNEGVTHSGSNSVIQLTYQNGKHIKIMTPDYSSSIFLEEDIANMRNEANLTVRLTNILQNTTAANSFCVAMRLNPSHHVLKNFFYF